MSASLVGSEMCIRDRPEPPAHAPPRRRRWEADAGGAVQRRDSGYRPPTCLLYTSDAADDM
eukprot:1613797-Alexandrium_andersonii.AAC.1